MGVPKHRGTKSQQQQRRMHLFLKEPKFALCKKCGQPVLPHIVCQNCGYYKGREVIDVMKKLSKKEKKLKERELKAKEAAEKRPASAEASAGKGEVKKESTLGWAELSKK